MRYDKHEIMKSAHFKYKYGHYSSFGEALTRTWLEYKLEAWQEEQYEEYEEERAYKFYAR